MCFFMFIMIKKEDDLICLVMIKKNDLLDS